MPHFGEISRVAGSVALSRPLDPYTTGVWCACGISKLLTSYNGPAIRVRRTSDNLEQDVGFDNSGALDVASLLTFCGANTGFIRVLYDQSGLGNHWDQSDGLKQPRIWNSGTYDGRIVWDGSNDCMTSRNPSGTPTAFSVFLRANLRAITGTQMLLEHGATFPTAAKNQFVYYNTGAVSLRTAVDLSQGNANFFENYWLNTLANDVHGMIGDRTESTQALQTRLWVAGVEQTSNGSSTTGSLPGGAFTAETWNLGARNNGAALPAQLDLFTLVIYETSKLAQVSAISNALA